MFSTNNEKNTSLNFDNYSTEKRQSFTEEQQKKYMLIEDIAKDFLFNECGYTEEQLSNSKSNASKVRKVVEITKKFYSLFTLKWIFIKISENKKTLT